MSVSWSIQRRGKAEAQVRDTGDCLTTSQRGQEGVPGHRCPGEEALPFHLLCLCRSAGLSSVNPFEQTHLCPALANTLGLGPIPLPFVSRLVFEGWRLGVDPRHITSSEKGGEGKGLSVVDSSVFTQMPQVL